MPLSVLIFVGWVFLPLVAAAETGIKPSVVGVVPGEKGVLQVNRVIRAEK